MSISTATRQEVRIRAADRCEYCRLAQSNFPLVTFHVEHVIARQHGELTRLFHPRTDSWDEHFHVVDGIIQGITNIGIATSSP